MEGSVAAQGRVRLAVAVIVYSCAYTYVSIVSCGHVSLGQRGYRIDIARPTNRYQNNKAASQQQHTVHDVRVVVEN